jgi:hypothetical protein
MNYLRKNLVGYMNENFLKMKRIGWLTKVAHKSMSGS